jgi:hypothetical protein
MILPLRRIRLEIEIPFNELEETLHIVSIPAGVIEFMGDGVEHVVHSGYIIDKSVVNLEMRRGISGKVGEAERDQGSQCTRRGLLLEGT